MRKFFLFFLLILSILFFISCNNNVEPDKAAGSESGGGSSSDRPGEKTDKLNGKVVDTSIMTMTFNGKTYSTAKQEYDYTFNLDEIGNLNTNFTFTCYHYDTDGKPIEGGFTFSCDDVETLYGTDDPNSCTLNALSLTELGTYTVYAKSEVGTIYDRYFMINVSADRPVVSITYSILSDYINPNLTYTSQMQGGTITKYTKELTLVAGAVYQFVVEDTSENEFSIKNLTLSSTNSMVYFREQSGNTGEFVCLQVDGAQSTLKFQVGHTLISVSVKITLADISQVDYSVLDNSGAIVEETLCFAANSISDPDKGYTYQINVQTPSTSAEDQEMMFCIDFENWDEEAENNYLTNPGFKVAEKETVNWYSRISLFKTYNSRNLFQVIVDGSLRQFKIIPLEDTVFTSRTLGTKNLHCYLYAKYKSDPSKRYRYKWRIMVGGVLEGVNIVSVESGSEVHIPDNTFELKEGVQTGWVLRAKGVPTTTSNCKTLWYVAEDKNRTERYSWSYNHGSTYVSQTLPVPASSKSDFAKPIQFSGGTTASSDFDTPFEYNTFDGSKQLKLGRYYYDQNSLNGISDVVVNYENNGASTYVVAVNLETGYYDVVFFRNMNDMQVILKGMTSYKIPNKVNILENPNDNTSRKPEIITEYGDSQKFEEGMYIQDYSGRTGYTPKIDGIGGNPVMNYRVFYMDVDNILRIHLDTTFELTDVVLTGNYQAITSFDNFANVFIDEGTRHSADIFLSTMWHSTPKGEERESEEGVMFQRNALTDKINLYLMLNNKYRITLNVIPYCKEANEIEPIPPPPST